jgi:hypothetical protein
MGEFRAAHVGAVGKVPDGSGCFHAGRLQGGTLGYVIGVEQLVHVSCSLEPGVVGYRDQSLIY